MPQQTAGLNVLPHLDSPDMAAEFHHLCGAVCAGDRTARIRRPPAKTDPPNSRGYPRFWLFRPRHGRVGMRRLRQRPAAHRARFPHRTANRFQRRLLRHRLRRHRLVPGPKIPGPIPGRLLTHVRLATGTRTPLASVLIFPASTSWLLSLAVTSPLLSSADENGTLPRKAQL